MRLTSITFVLLLLLGCNQKSKPEDLDKIEQIKIELKKCESSSENLVKKVEKLQKDIDSLEKYWFKKSSIDVLDNPNRLINNANILAYEDTINDEYWKRGVYFKSPKNGEYLYNVKVHTVNNNTNFYFIGLKPPKQTGEEITVNIYELDENKNLYIIDSFNLLAYKATDRVIDRAEIYMDDFFIRQADNLIISNGILYYFKELDYPDFDDSFYEIISKRKYYQYHINSKNPPQPLNNFILTNTIIQAQSSNRGLINNQKNLLAENSSGYISFYSIPNWNLAYNDFYNPDRKHIPTSNLKKIDFDFNTYFFSDYSIPVDPDTNEEVFFGGMCWHSRKNILYFDNYGIDTRCIWKVDLDDKSIEKIVPEHEALQPYFFEIKNNEYLAYVEKNQIMICESPNNVNDKKSNNN